MKVEEIQEAIRARRVRVTDHAVEESATDRLSIREVVAAILHGGEVIETYPEREPFPRCLVLSFTPRGIPLHSVWEWGRAPGWVALVTVYRPNPAEWIEWRRRR